MCKLAASEGVSEAILIILRNLKYMSEKSSTNPHKYYVFRQFKKFTKPLSHNILWRGFAHIIYVEKRKERNCLMEAKIVDHLGNKYKSLAAMCAAYPVQNRSTFRYRIVHGMNLEEALMTPPSDGSSKTVTDHRGNTYPSVKSMCAAYPVKNDRTYFHRLSIGWTQEEALTIKDGNKKETEDHLGNTFPSVKAMCAAHPVKNAKTYGNRIRKGWSKEKALMTPIDPDKHQVTDHLGNTFSTISEMCAAYPVGNIQTYNSRLRKGWSQEEALISHPAFDKHGVANSKDEKHVAKNGCEYKILEVKDYKNIIVEFADGSVTTTTTASVKAGCVKHPTLSMRDKGVFAGFSTKFAFSEGENVYYTCTCKKCGLRDILSVKQMLGHNCDI